MEEVRVVATIKQLSLREPKPCDAIDAVPTVRKFGDKRK